MRLAIGAAPAQVARLVAADGLWPVVVGLLAGLVGAAWLRTVLASILFGVGGFDILAYGLAAVILFVIAIAACAAPAMRAASIDPARALQSQ